MRAGAVYNMGALQQPSQEDIDRIVRHNTMHQTPIIDKSLKNPFKMFGKDDILIKKLNIGPAEQQAFKEVNEIFENDLQSRADQLRGTNLREKFIIASEKYPEDDALFTAQVIRIVANIEERNANIFVDNHDHKLSCKLHEIAIEQDVFQDGQTLCMILEREDKREEAENILKNIDYEEMPLSLDYINSLKIPSIEQDGTCSYRPFKTIDEFIKCLRGFEETTELSTMIGSGETVMELSPSQVLEFRMLRRKYANIMKGDTLL